VSVAVSRLPARFREATVQDFASICEIENSVYEFPWTEKVFTDCINAGYVCMVYENVHKLFGYGVMSFVDGECHVLNLGIEASYQGAGWGKSFMIKLLDLAQKRKCRVVFLEVRISNKRAFSLYHDLGFNEIAVRKNYYPASGGKRENALVLAKVMLGDKGKDKA